MTNTKVKVHAGASSVQTPPQEQHDSHCLVVSVVFFVGTKRRALWSVVLFWKAKKSARSGRLNEVVDLVPHEVMRVGRDRSASKCAATRGVERERGKAYW